MQEQTTNAVQGQGPIDRSFQKLAEYEAAIEHAWGELELDPTLNGNPALSCSGTTCCACY